MLAERKQLWLWSKVYAILLLPILIYALCLLTMAIYLKAYFAFCFALFSIISLPIAMGWITVELTNMTFLQNVSKLKLPSLLVKRPFWSWPLFHLIEKQRLLIFVAKLVSIFSFKAILFMFADVGSDVRVYETAMLAVIISHAVLIFQLVKFNAKYLSFVQALPIRNTAHLINSSIVSSLVLIPELGLLLWLTHFELATVASCLIYSLSGMLSLQLLVYLMKANMERYIKYLLLFFFLNMFVILSGNAISYSIIMLASCGLMLTWKYAATDWEELA